MWLSLLQWDLDLVRNVVVFPLKHAAANTHRLKKTQSKDIAIFSLGAFNILKYILLLLNQLKASLESIPFKTSRLRNSKYSMATYIRLLSSEQKPRICLASHPIPRYLVELSYQTAQEPSNLNTGLICKTQPESFLFSSFLKWLKWLDLLFTSHKSYLNHKKAEAFVLCYSNRFDNCGIVVGNLLDYFHKLYFCCTG